METVELEENRWSFGILSRLSKRQWLWWRGCCEHQRCHVVLTLGCTDCFGMLMHPVRMDQGGYPYEWNPPQDPSLMDL